MLSLHFCSFNLFFTALGNTERPNPNQNIKNFNLRLLRILRLAKNMMMRDIELYSPASFNSLTFFITHSELKEMFFRLFSLQFLKTVAPTVVFSATFSVLLFLSGCAQTRPFVHNVPDSAQIEPSVKKEQKNSGETLSSATPLQQQPVPQPIQIIGGVKNPGNIAYREGADLSFYLSQAGAPDTNEESAKIQIIRGAPGKKEAQEFRLGQGNIPAIQSGDIVIVHAPKKTFIEKSFAVAASAAAILGTAALLILVV
jgi:hypothetical protein